MGILWPHSNTVIRTNADARAAGAKIYFFEAGTTTPRTSYQDASLTTPHTHPVIADAYGRAPAVFLDFGDYRERVRTSGDTTLWDTDDIPNAAPIDPDEDTDPNAIFQTGDIIFVGKNGTRDGFVRWNGRTIGSATSGGSERANPDCQDAFLYLWNNFANGQCAVSGGRGANAAADWAANKVIATPSCRGAGLIGFDDMGNSAASLLGSAPVVSGSGILAGSIIGANTHTLITSEAPQHTHSFSATTSSDNGHSHTYSGTTSSDGAHNHTVDIAAGQGAHNHLANDAASFWTNKPGGFSVAGGAGSSLITDTEDASLPAMTGSATSSGAHTHTYSGSTSTQAAHTHTVSGTSGSTGGGTAHNNLSRSIPVTVLMKL